MFSRYLAVVQQLNSKNQVSVLLSFVTPAVSRLSKRTKMIRTVKINRKITLFPLFSRRVRTNEVFSNIFSLFLALVTSPFCSTLSISIDNGQTTNNKRSAVPMHSKLIALPVERRSEPGLSLAGDNDGNSLAGDVAVLEASRGDAFYIII